MRSINSGQPYLLISIPLGPIKALLVVAVAGLRIEFQFHLVRLKPVVIGGNTKGYGHFNSTWSD